MATSDDREIRERLVWRGAEVLSDAELVSILIADKGVDSAVDKAEELIGECGGSIEGFGRLGVRDLRSKHSIGIKAAAQIAAAVELGRRVLRCSTDPNPIVVDSSDVVKLIAPLVEALPYEELWVLYLTSSGRVIEHCRVAQGGVTGMTVDLKLIVKRAVELLCSSIILVHNHPSGSAEPSAEDRDLTAKVEKAAALLDIALLDHIIIARGASFSFHAEQRRLGTAQSNGSVER